MRRRCSVLVLLTLLLGGCSGSSDEATTQTTQSATREDVAELQAPLEVTSPEDGATVEGPSVTLTGTSPASDEDGLYRVDVIGIDDPSEEASYTIPLKPRDGKWSAKLRLYKGENAIYPIRLPPGFDDDVLPERGTPGYTIVDFTLYRGGGQRPKPKPKPDLSGAVVKIKSPAEESQVTGDTVTVTGTGRPEGAPVEVELVTAGPAKDYKRKTTVQDGRWRVVLPIRGQASTRSILASIGDDAVDLRDVTWSAGSSGDVAELLLRKGAVGLTSAQLRARLGRPDKSQDVAGTRYWYYDTAAGNTYQVVIEGDRVAQVNRY